MYLHASFVEFDIATEPTLHFIEAWDNQDVFSGEVVEPEVAHILKESRGKRFFQLLRSPSHGDRGGVEMATQSISCNPRLHLWLSGYQCLGRRGD